MFIVKNIYTQKTPLLISKRLRHDTCEMVKCRAHLTFIKYKLRSALAPSVFGAMWFCRWVVTHSLNGFRLPWPPSCGLYHIEHPFAFIGRLEQTLLSPAYLESVRLNPSSPVLLTRNGPLRILDALVLRTFTSHKSNFSWKVAANRTDLKFERRPRSYERKTRRYLVSLLYPKVLLVLSLSAG